MAVARASLRQKLCSAPFASIRLTASTSTRACYSTREHTDRPFSPRRMIPEQCKPFFKSDGTLFTDQMNLEFLRKYNITHDNAEAFHTVWTGINRSIFSRFGCVVNFTPKHVISPYHLSFLDPRGHPLASQHRARYAHRALTQPTWFIATCSSKAKAVVRISAQRRLRAAVYGALEAKGYNRYGKGEHKDITGTVWIHVNDPFKAVSCAEKEAFGNSVVYLMEMAQKQSILRGKVGAEDLGFIKKRRRGNMSLEQLDKESEDPDFRAADVPVRKPYRKRKPREPQDGWHTGDPTPRDRGKQVPATGRPPKRTTSRRPPFEPPPPGSSF